MYYEVLVREEGVWDKFRQVDILALGRVKYPLDQFEEETLYARHEYL